MSADLKTICQIVPPVQPLASIGDLSIPWPGFPTSGTFLSRLKRYGYTKILNEYFKDEFQRRLGACGCDIVLMSTNPGMIKTGGSIANYPLIFKAAAYIMGTTPTAGATSALFRATAEKVNTDKKKYKGSYLIPKATLGPTSAESGCDADERAVGGDAGYCGEGFSSGVIRLDHPISSSARCSSFH
jgi:hypothetical protein